MPETDGSPGAVEQADDLLRMSEELEAAGSATCDSCGTDTDLYTYVATEETLCGDCWWEHPQGPWPPYHNRGLVRQVIDPIRRIIHRGRQ